MGYNITPVAKLQQTHSRGLLLAAAFARLGMDRQSIAVRECGTFLEVTTVGETDHITAANFCRERLCPSCIWRRSLRIYNTTSQILDYLDRQPDPPKYLFLTLTVANCDGEHLAETLDSMAEGYHRLINNKAWKRRILGAMRILEITRNAETGLYHPHYHLILAVPRSYGKKTDKLYWTHQDWLEAWQKAARLPYSPSVRIEAVKGTRHKQVAEVAKYLAKDTDYIVSDDTESTDTAVRVLYHSLHGRRLVAYSGVLRRAQQALRLMDPEDAPLTDTIRGDVATAIRRYRWSAGLGSYIPHTI